MKNFNVDYFKCRESVTVDDVDMLGDVQAHLKSI